MRTCPLTVRVGSVLLPVIQCNLRSLKLDEGEEADELDPEEPEAVDELDELCELVVGVDEPVLLSLLLLVDELSLLDLVSEFPLPSDAVLFTSVFSPLFSDLASGSLSLSE